MLNLHFVKQNVAIFGYLDVACTTDQHLHGSFRTEVGFQHILNQTIRCIHHLVTGLEQTWMPLAAEMLTAKA